MSEYKGLFGKPFGLLISKLYTLRALAQCFYKTYNPKSGAPKLGRSFSAFDPLPNDSEVEEDFDTKSLEESELFHETYYDYAHEIKSGGISIDPDIDGYDWLPETGLGQPTQHTGTFNVQRMPNTQFSKAIYYAHGYMKDGVGTVTNNNTARFLYPRCVTEPVSVQIDKDHHLAKFSIARRQDGIALFIEASSGTFKIKTGNWVSDPIDISTTPTFQNSTNFTDLKATNGEDIEGTPFVFGTSARLRSNVWAFHINGAFYHDQSGGIRDDLCIETDGLVDYVRHSFIPLSTAVGTAQKGFQYSYSKELVGHYVDVSIPPWLGIYSTSKIAAGPGYVELVLNQWKLISLTVANNLTGGVSGEY